MHSARVSFILTLGFILLVFYIFGLLLINRTLTCGVGPGKTGMAAIDLMTEFFSESDRSMLQLRRSNSSTQKETSHGLNLAQLQEQMKKVVMSEKQFHDQSISMLFKDQIMYILVKELYHRELQDQVKQAVTSDKFHDLLITKFLEDPRLLNLMKELHLRELQDEAKKAITSDKQFQDLLISTLLKDPRLLSQVKAHLDKTPRDAKAKEVLQKGKIDDNQTEAYYIAQKKRPMDNVFLYKPLVSPQNPCPERTFALILVYSHPESYQRRQTLRYILDPKSYKNGTGAVTANFLSKSKTVFMLAKGTTRHNISEEIAKYNDIIMYPFVDSYENLTLKTLASLQFIDRQCLHVRYWIKLDSDTFFNLPKLFTFLESNTFNRTIVGELTPHSAVLRGGRWAVPTNLFPLSHYPTYVQGQCYIITTDLVPDLFAQAQRMKWVNIEDAFITGIVAKIVNAKHVAIPGVRSKDYEWRSICRSFGDTTAYVSPVRTDENLMKLHKLLLTGKCEP